MNTRYAKAYVPLVAGLLYAAQAVAVGGDWPTFTEWVAIVLALLTSYGVYAVPNRQPPGLIP